MLLFAHERWPSADVSGHFARWWPLVVVAVGLGGLARIAWRRPAMLIPLVMVMVVAGTALTLRTTGAMSSSADRYIGPTLAIAVGLAILVRAYANWKNPRPEKAPLIGRIVAVAETRKVTWPHKDKSLAQVVTFASGCVINIPRPDNFTKARLEITAVLSGVEVLIPPGWQVEDGNSHCIAGRFEKLEPKGSDSTLPLLQIEGIAVGSRVVLTRP